MNNFLQFFQGHEGENSAKRLVGIIAGFVFCYLAIRGGIHFLAKDQAKDFNDLIETVGYFSLSLLCLGVADRLIKKKYASNQPENPSNS